MHLKLEVLAILPQWCLGKLEVVHSRQILACAISMANMATLQDIAVLAMAVDSKAKI